MKKSVKNPKKAAKKAKMMRKVFATGRTVSPQNDHSVELDGDVIGWRPGPAKMRHTKYAGTLLIIRATRYLGNIIETVDLIFQMHVDRVCFKF